MVNLLRPGLFILPRFWVVDDIATTTALKIDVTANHPFYVKDKDKWVKASKLEENDELVVLNQDEPELVAEVVPKKLAAKVTVYNLKIEGGKGTDNYFVSKHGILVHNCSPGGDIPFDKIDDAVLLHGGIALKESRVWAVEGSKEAAEEAAKLSLELGKELAEFALEWGVPLAEIAIALGSKNPGKIINAMPKYLAKKRIRDIGLKKDERPHFGKQEAHTQVNSGDRAKGQDYTPKLKQWEINNPDKVVLHPDPRIGKIERDPKTKLWWSKDKAGHGDSAWKVFEKDGNNLRWIEDADINGNYLKNKHKSDFGVSIPMKDLKVIK